MKKCILVLMSIFCLCGCQKQPAKQANFQQRENLNRYIAAFEQSLQEIDTLNSRALYPLLSKTQEHNEDSRNVIIERFQHAKGQFSAASIMLQEKEIPVEIPKTVRDELLAAKDRLSRAYRIKLKSLDLLREYRLKNYPYLLEKYRRLSDESAAMIQESKLCISKARKLSEIDSQK